ncbi:MAG: hypothetical protein EXR71_14960 [Myxococcales bacterium]|nr:hypothetical protein [Myxococcales bacterium]
MASEAERFRTAIDLHEAGVQLMRLKLRRLYPQESDAERGERLRSWLRGPELEIRDHRWVPWPRS